LARQEHWLETRRGGPGLDAEGGGHAQRLDQLHGVAAGRSPGPGEQLRRPAQFGAEALFRTHQILADRPDVRLGHVEAGRAQRADVGAGRRHLAQMPPAHALRIIAVEMVGGDEDGEGQARLGQARKGLAPYRQGGAVDGDGHRLVRQRPALPQRRRQFGDRQHPKAAAAQFRELRLELGEADIARRAVLAEQPIPQDDRGIRGSRLARHAGGQCRQGGEAPQGATGHGEGAGNAHQRSLWRAPLAPRPAVGHMNQAG
jgi:hypothetical protein